MKRAVAAGVLLLSWLGMVYAVSPPYYTGAILPTPKRAVYQDRFLPVYDGPAAAPSVTVLTGSGEAARLAAQDLVARMAELVGAPSSGVPVRALTEAPPGGHLIVLGAAVDPALQRLAETLGLALPRPTGEQGYILRTVAAEGRLVCLGVGGGPMGTTFAAGALAQLLKVDAGQVLLRAAEVDDWPTFELRGTCCYTPAEAAWLALARFSTLDCNYGTVGKNAWRDPDGRGLPPGWGHYSGAGSLDVSVSAEGPHGGRRCAAASVASLYHWPDRPDSISAALVLGDSNGYSGRQALPAAPGGYHLAAWLRGSIPRVQVSVTAWAGPDGTAGERRTIPVAPASVDLTSDWQRHEFRFELPAGLQTFAVLFRVDGGAAAGIALGQELCVDDVVLTGPTGPANLAGNGDVESTGRSYSATVAALWDWAVPRGLWPVQYVNPLNVSGWEDGGALKIRVSDPRQIDDLARTFRLSLDRGGTWVMLALDDFASRLGGPAPYYVITDPADRQAFHSLGECHGVLVRELQARLRATHPGVRMLVCPAYYWLPKDGYREEGEAYLREFGRLVPEDVLIVWTGPRVRSRTIASEDLARFTELIGRKPYLWDNTIYARHAAPMYLLDPFEPHYPERFWEATAGGLHNNGNANEIYKVGCLVYGDYAWNPEAYDPQASLDRALAMVLGEAGVADAHAFREHYYAVRDPYPKLTSDLSRKSAAELVAAVGPLTRPQVDDIAGHVTTMDAALARLRGTSPNQALLAVLEGYASPLRAAAAVLRQQGDLTAAGVTATAAGLDFAEWSFVGGAGHQVYDNHCPARRATWIYGRRTATHTLTASFRLEQVPTRPAALLIDGQNSDKGGQTRVEVVLNGTTLFSGPNPCPAQAWQEWRLDLPAGQLRAGPNVLAIRNLEDSDSTNAAWFMLARARIVWQPE